MAEVQTGETYEKENPFFDTVSAGNTPANPGAGLIVFDGTDLKINVAATGAAPDWKTITIT